MSRNINNLATGILLVRGSCHAFCGSRDSTNHGLPRSGEERYADNGEISVLSNAVDTHGWRGLPHIFSIGANHIDGRARRSNGRDDRGYLNNHPTNPLLRVSSCKSLDANSLGLVVLIAALKQQLDKHALYLGVCRRAKLRLSHGKRCFHKRQQLVIIGSVDSKVDHLMLHHARLNAALGLPDDHGIHASDMGVRGVAIKSFVSQAHSLIKKVFMVHRQIIYGLGLIGHSYFPVDWYAYIVGKATLNRIQFVLHEVESA